MTNWLQTKNTSDITMVCFPFMFALREGIEFDKNLMGYTLLLLQRTCAECIKSPIPQEQPRAVLVDNTLSHVKNKLS